MLKCTALKVRKFPLPSFLINFNWFIAQGSSRRLPLLSFNLFVSMYPRYPIVFLFLLSLSLGYVPALYAQLTPDQSSLKATFQLLNAQPVNSETPESAHQLIESASARLQQVNSLRMLEQLEEGAMTELIYAQLWNLDYVRSGNGVALDSALVHFRKANSRYANISHDQLLTANLQSNYGFSCENISAVYYSQRYLVSLDVEKNLLLSHKEFLKSGWYDWNYIRAQASREAPSRTLSEIVFAFFQLHQSIKSKDCDHALPYACGLYELVNIASGGQPIFPLWQLMPPVEFETGLRSDKYIWIMPASQRGQLYLGQCSRRSDNKKEAYDPAWDQSISRLRLTQEVSSLLNDLKSRCKYDVPDLVKTGAVGFKELPRTAAVESNIDNFNQLPQLKFPLPAPSGKVVLPGNFFPNAHAMGDVSRKLESAMSGSGYFDYSYYEVPGGFALVSRLEQIRPDGTPKPDPSRWSTAVTPDQEFTLSRFVKALFFAEPGYFRIIFFVVTDRVNFLTTGETLSASRGIGLAAGGAAGLGPVEDEPFTGNHRVTALVYEFEVSESQSAQKAKQVVPSTIQTRTHLEKSGLWGNLARP